MVGSVLFSVCLTKTMKQGLEYMQFESGELMSLMDFMHGRVTAPAMHSGPREDGVFSSIIKTRRTKVFHFVRSIKK